MLLMLALPLQAFASASVLGCAFTHAADMQEMAMTDDMMVGCHEHDTPDAPPAQHDCKHCAACVLASALPIPVTDTPAVMSTPFRFALQTAVLLSGILPEGPERPPRTALV